MSASLQSSGNALGWRAGLWAFDRLNGVIIKQVSGGFTLWRMDDGVAYEHFLKPASKSEFDSVYDRFSAGVTFPAGGALG